MALASKKKPILLISILVFWVGYACISITFYTLSLNSLNNEHTKTKKKNIDYQFDLAIDYLIRGSNAALIDNLETARKLDHINFFILRQNGKNIAFGTNNSNLAGIDHEYPYKDEWITTKDDSLVFKSKIIADYELTLGAVTANTEFLFYQFNQKKIFFFSELAFVSLFSLALIAFLLKDILKLTRRLRTKEANLDGLSALSSEAESILTATQTLQSSGVALAQTNQTYSQVITPALLEELRLQTPAPSSFRMTLVRVDLNGYTRIFLEKREQYITEILNLYFRKAREAIERYDGLIYQYIGDEIIFHIKDTSEISSTLKALFCIRHLFEIAEEVERKFARSQGHEFKIKCSLATGQLYFVELDQGYGFSGLPLIETVRMLGAYSEKKENTLCLYDDDARLFGKYLQIDETKESLFKGFSEKTDVALVKKFTKLSELLGKSPVQELVNLYKTDMDIQFWLEHLKMSIVQNEKEYFFKVFNELKEFKVEEHVEGLTLAYTNLLRWTYSEYKKQDSLKTYLSALSSLAYNLIPASSFNQELYQIFELILQSEDPRTQANALATLSEFDPNSMRYKGYIEARSNRLAANALLVEAKKNFNTQIYETILGFLKSDNPYFVASGLYVAEQVFLHYKQNNVVFFKSYPLFSKLEDQCLKYMDHENQMIHARAHKVSQIFHSPSSKAS